MYAELFEFNGIKSDEVGVGYRIANFDGFNNDGIISAGSNVTFSTSKPTNSSKWNFNGSKVEDQLTTTFQIFKILCSGKLDDYELSQQECVFLQRWLERSDGYKYLRFFQGGYEGYENSFFNCQIKLSWIKFKGKIIGAQCDVTCDSNSGYSEQKTYEVSCNSGDTFIIYDDSDRMGAIYFDEVKIVTKSNISELRIVNAMDNLYSPTIEYITKIRNCQNNETIIIANNTIRSDKEGTHSKGNINEDFNFKYPRLINLSHYTEILDDEGNPYHTIDELRKNEFTVNGKCDLSFKYRTIRSVMP